MGAQVSSAMEKAKKLVEGGATAYAAAQKSRISASAIYQSKWYKKHKAELAASAKP